ncbi:hypothetical protein EL18_02091 [Nitratireductor basaltis]|uniref:Uncharacterized protein n=2 Tax=Nitratireductor basaltis TaxID=472175 RepID=A0A084UDL3_9HYPH|nr:hypothetical protein EL18_02091 [Nitratireductor basaltis]
MQLTSFLECVDEYSFEAVHEACLRYRKGEVVGHDARFAPSTAQFTQQVKERQSYIDFRKIKAAEKLPQPAQGRRPARHFLTRWENGEFQKEQKGQGA